MPAPNLDKETYTPGEVHQLIQDNLGDEAAQHFRLYFNKVQKVPPHRVELHKLTNYGDEMFEYRFRGDNLGQLLGIPPEIIQFVMVESERHGGGGQDNVGWLRIKFKTIKSEEGNEVKIAILDECQSDFAQRISRLRKYMNNTMGDKGIGGSEGRAWDAIKNNPELVTKVKPEGQEDPLFTTNIGGWTLKFKNPNDPEFIDIYLDGQLLRTIRPDGRYDESNILPLTDKGKEAFQRDYDKLIYPALMKMFNSVKNLGTKDYNNAGVTYKPTDLLKNIFTKIEKTSYSDILNYLFNKAVGFSKSKGCQQLWVPSSKMMMDRWKQYARQGEDALVEIYKRVYDDNSVTFEAVRDIEKKITGEDNWVIDLSKVPDIKLARKRFCNANWQSKDGMNPTNWTTFLDSYIEYYRKNPVSPREDEEQNEGGTMYENDPSNDYLMLSSFIDQMVPLEAHGDENWVNRFKKYLDQKFGLELPPELYSKLLTPAENYGWKPVEKRPPKQEVSPDAPSSEDLNKMFKWDSLRSKLK